MSLHRAEAEGTSKVSLRQGPPLMTNQSGRRLSQPVRLRVVGGLTLM